MVKVERIRTNAESFTGERFEFLVTEAELELEHIHRYVMASRLINGGRVLDAASGAGYGSNILSHVAAEVHGVDISQESVDTAQSKYSRPNLHFHCCDATQLPFDDHSFDVVVSFETLEHLEAQEDLLSGFKRVLKPNGLLIISTPEKANYNQSLSEPNAYHVKELETPEFEKLLSRHFRRHTIVGQRVVFGSLISSEIIESPELKILRRQGDGQLTSNRAYDKAMYLIALCSDGPLPALEPEIYEGSIPQNAMSSLVGGIEDRDRTVRGLRQEMHDLRTDNARLNEHESQREGLLAELGDLRQVGARLTESESQREALLADIASLRHEAEAELQRNRNLQRVLSQVEADRRYFSSLMTKANDELATLREAYRSHVTRGQVATDESARQMAVLRGQIESLEGERAALDATLASEREQFAADSAKSRERLERQEADLVQFVDSLSAAQDEIERSRQDLVAVRNELSELRDEFDQRTRTLDETKVELAGLMDSLSTAESGIEQYRQDLDDARNALSELRDEFDQRTRTLDETNVELARLMDSLSTAEGRIEQDHQELDSARNALSDLRDEFDRRTRTLDETNVELARLMDSLSTAEGRIEQDHQELDSARNALSDLRDEFDRRTRTLDETQVELSRLRSQFDLQVATLNETLTELAELRDELTRRAAAEQILSERLAEVSAESARRSATQETIVRTLNADLFAHQKYAERLVALLYEKEAATDPAPALSDMMWAVRNYIRTRQNPLRAFNTVRYFRKHGGFDKIFYQSQLATPLSARIDRLRHYIASGWQASVDPSPAFNTAKYLETYKDVSRAKIEPAYHYFRFGKAEGRRAFASDRGFKLPGPDCVVNFLSQAASPTQVQPAFTQPHQDSRPHIEDRIDAEWILARKPKTDPASLGLYDIRPDDEVPLEGQRGIDFMKRFALLSESPDFAGAITDLNALTPVGALIGETADQPIDVSIVIPIYGQLAYTLNCLHSLFTHASQYRFEILIGDDCSPDDSGLWLPKVKHIRYVKHQKNGGFIENCNRTGEQARGRYILMLNNDVRVVENWLDELIGSFDIFPKAGLVGSKLFYDDGSLQEAGGIVWKDGSAWNYGREDDPNRPRYCYARQVDYISGCSIAIPMDLWKTLGGFDPHYRPAYAEDSDLCFRIRHHGYETWYQPLSRVIHYEGKTSGTDTTQGVKAYQVTNKEKLLARWKDTLSAHRDNAVDPWLERERNVTRRALVIDATNPTPWMDAGSVTTFTTMQIYQRLGYKVYFVPQDNFLYEPRQVNDLQRMGVECAYAPYEVYFTDYIKKYGHLFDVIQVFRVGVAEKVVNDIRKHAPQAKIAFHNMDLHFLRMEREAELSGDPKHMAEAKAVRQRELTLISSVDCTIVHSPVEEDMLRDVVPDAPVVVFPYMTPFEGTEKPFEDRHDIMFLGGYGHTPNADAVEFFVRDIWPRIKNKLPKARYLIVGAKPSEKIKALADDRIIVTGMVEDLQPWFDSCRIFAATIRYGAGVKGKVSTAMAHGVPVIATDCAAEGMYLENGESVLIANSPEEIAEQIISLYNDADEWNRLSQNSMAFVKTYNSFDMGVATVQKIVEVATQKHAKPRH